MIQAGGFLYTDRSFLPFVYPELNIVRHLETGDGSHFVHEVKAIPPKKEEWRQPRGEGTTLFCAYDVIAQRTHKVK